MFEIVAGELRAKLLSGGRAWPDNTQTPRPIGGRREACGAWPGFETTRRAKLGVQQDLLAREAVDLVHDEAAHGAHPRDGCDAEDAGTPGPHLQEVLETVAGSW